MQDTHAITDAARMALRGAARDLHGCMASCRRSW